MNKELIEAARELMKSHAFLAKTGYAELMADFALSVQPQWIPVSERLPEKSEHRYLVTLTTGGIDVATFDRDYPRSWTSIYGVTAWMPLPSPFKAGESDGR